MRPIPMSAPPPERVSAQIVPATAAEGGEDADRKPIEEMKPESASRKMMSVWRLRPKRNPNNPPIPSVPKELVSRDVVVGHADSAVKADAISKIAAKIEAKASRPEIVTIARAANAASKIDGAAASVIAIREASRNAGAARIVSGTNAHSNERRSLSRRVHLSAQSVGLNRFLGPNPSLNRPKRPNAREDKVSVPIAQEARADVKETVRIKVDANEVVNKAKADGAVDRTGLRRIRLPRVKDVHVGAEIANIKPAKQRGKNARRSCRPTATSGSQAIKL